MATESTPTPSPVLDTQKRINLLVEEVAQLSNKQEIKKKIEALIVSAPQSPLAPNTTEQEDITTAGQRRINVIWEVTQSVIALVIVLGNVAVAVYQGLIGHTTEFPSILSNSLFLVIGFYFSRTNHQAIGGVGRKVNENDTYSGR